MAEAPAIGGSCAIRPAGVPEGSQCVLADWGPNGYPAHWVYTPPEVPQTDDQQQQDDKPCETCGPKTSIKRKTSYGPLYSTTTTPTDGSAPTYGFGVQSTPGLGPSSPQMCTTYGDSPGVTSTVSGSAFGGSVASRQSFSAPFSDSAHSFETCVPVAGSPPSFSPGVSVGIGGIK
jgi:hypothetical protein